MGHMALLNCIAQGFGQSITWLPPLFLSLLPEGAHRMHLCLPAAASGVATNKGSKPSGVNDARMSCTLCSSDPAAAATSYRVVFWGLGVGYRWFSMHVIWHMPLVRAAR